MNLLELSDATALIGRILIAYVFIPSGIEKLIFFSRTVVGMSSRRLPAPAVLCGLTVLLQIAGGTLLLIGLQARWAAALLALFTLLSGIVYHNYWNAVGEERRLQKLSFEKNIGMVGGLLALVAFGPGQIVLDIFQ